MKVERTKTGLPALWESGGGRSNTGEAIIITGPEGEMLSPIYVRKYGHLANENHALFVIAEGYLVFYAEHSRKDFYITVSRVDKVSGDEADLVGLTTFNHGEWSFTPPENWLDAAAAVMAKAVCYHCREPHYALPMPEPAKPTVNNMLINMGNEPMKESY